MKRRTIIFLIGGFFLILIIKNIVSFLGSRWLEEDIAVIDPVKTVQTQIIAKSPFQEQIHVTGRVGSLQEVTVSTQGTGFIESILARIGDTVAAWQVLARIGDTYGTVWNAVGTASLGVEWAYISQGTMLVSLSQALRNAQIAFEKAQKDYEATQKNAQETLAQAERTAASLQVGVDTAWNPISKAQLDLNNYIATQQKQLDAFETSYDNQLDAFQSFVSNVIDTADTLLGVSEQKVRDNDAYEYLLSAKDAQKKFIAEASLRELMTYKTWSPEATDDLLKRVTDLQRVQWITNDVLMDLETVLLNTITDVSVFSPATLNAYRSTVDAYQTQYSTLSTGLVNFLNNAQTFLATYKDERTSREQAVALAAQNAQNTLAQTRISVDTSLRAAQTGLEMAQNAYTSAQKSYEFGVEQAEQGVSLASFRLSDAQGWLDRLSVKAPFSGSIISRTIEVGSLVSPWMTLFTLWDASQLVVKADITVEQQTFLTLGQEVPMTTSKGLIIGTLSHISAGPDAQTHLYRIEVTLPSKSPVSLGDIVDLTLPGEMVSIDGVQKQYIVVPYSALKNLGQENYVIYVLSPKSDTSDTWIAHERWVKIGHMNETSVTIAEWLELGERVVVVGTLNIEDGDEVQLPKRVSPIEIPSTSFPEISEE